MTDTQQSDSTMSADEKDMQAYRRLPLIERQANFWSLIGASIALGIGTGSFAIGLGAFLALFYVASTVSNEMARHRRTKD